MADQDPMQQANDMNDLIAQAAQVQADLQKAQEEILATNVKAAGERGTDLAVRLVYADISHELIPDPMDALAACPEGRIEVLANYTAFRDLKKALSKEATNA